ncbi:MAG: FAD-dependent oxidoreductase [Chthoniobacterales bacterium]
MGSLDDADDAIGGVAREFYRRVGAHYGVDEHWHFEPYVAEEIFSQWVKEEKIDLHFDSFLARVEMRDNRIARLWTENGIEVAAKMFIDCSYEGDLMAAAKVSHTVGRESNEQYGETCNGAQVFNKHQFELPVDPYLIEGDSQSGLLPGIEAREPIIGQGDHRVQAYNFRLCLCKNPNNQLPITEPEDYDRSHYELLARYLRAGYILLFNKFDPLVNGKVDMNNHGAFSTDFIGANHAFPNASYKKRETLFQAHVSYLKGLLWFWKQDPDVPKVFQDPFQQWGWAADEFINYGGFSQALYVREARRLVGELVMTEHYCTGAQEAEDSLALAAYTMDSHNCRRFARDGRVWNEGDVQVKSGPPYPISYRSVIPKLGECENLLVPFCISASHIAFGSIRMEPVFMILAESCAHAAALAIRKETSVQRIPYEDLRAQLLAAKQILDPTLKAVDAQSGE